MKICLNTELFLTNGLLDEEVYYLLGIINNCSFARAEHSLIEKGYITRGGDSDGKLLPTEKAYSTIESIILQSDKSIPSKQDCTELAKTLIGLFPKGLKTNNSAWRGNTREITLKLQKFFKLYGTRWSNDEIIEATRKYVEHFNGDYTYMRVLKYFIIKSVTKPDEDGIGHIEEVSDLATWLENDTDVNNNDWLNELR